MSGTRFPVVEHRPASRDVPVAADTLIPFGNLTALSKSGHAVLAGNVPGVSLLGVATGPARGLPRKNGDTDNRRCIAGVHVVHVQTGLFRFLNSSAAPVTAAELGAMVFVEDERTVARTGSHGVAAGVAVGLIGAVYVWLFVGPAGSVPGMPAIGGE